MKKIKKIKLVNAKSMSILHPDSFEYWEEEISKLQAGDIVKVCDKRERFWVVVQSVIGDEIVARVDSYLLGDLLTREKPSCNYGDLISFNRDNIYQVWTKEMQEDLKTIKESEIKTSSKN